MSNYNIYRFFAQTGSFIVYIFLLIIYYIDDYSISITSLKYILIKLHRLNKRFKNNNKEEIGII